jgi:hypothetical protein
MDEENVAYKQIVLLFRHKNNEIMVCRKIVPTGDHYVKQNNPDSERNALHMFPLMCNLN